LKKFFAIFLLIVLSAVCFVPAMATTDHPFDFNLRTTTSSSVSYIVYNDADKNDNARRYYVTLTTNQFSDRRTYFRSYDTGSLQVISNTATATGTGTGNATYKSGYGEVDYLYDLRARAEVLSGESAGLRRKIIGRWDP